MYIGYLPPKLIKSGGKTCNAIAIGRFNKSVSPVSSKPLDFWSGSTTLFNKTPVATTPFDLPKFNIPLSNQFLDEAYLLTHKNYITFKINPNINVIASGARFDAITPRFNEETAETTNKSVEEPLILCIVGLSTYSWVPVTLIIPWTK